VHEFPEVQAMVRKACLQAPAGAHITRLTIVVGEASGHDPRHIQEHFTDASRGTPAQGATLALHCNNCGGTELIITGGNDVRLSAVEYDN
jgi:Zn finger protein HypA/HybF involved in hydrogenase expression